MNENDEIITISLRRSSWRIITDYFEGDVEAMGDSAPHLQAQAREALDWIQYRMTSRRVKKATVREIAAACAMLGVKPNDPSSATAATKRPD